MSGRRSPDALPRAPLELAHPLDVQAAEVPGARIAAELPPDEAAPLLKVLRAVMAWTRDPLRAAEVVDGAALRRLEGELLRRPFDEGPWAALAVLARAMARPHDAEPREVAWACACVAEWGLERRAADTALDFARGAALAWPDHARYAWLIGRILRNHGELGDAEVWLRRSHRVAVWTDDWEAQALSLNSLGNLRCAMGRFRDGRDILVRALRVAQRRHLRELEGEVSHDLFVVHAEMGDIETAERFAVAAFHQYNPRHRRMLMLLHDIAQFWTEQGYYWRTLPVFRLLVGLFADPEARIRVLAGLARAAGAAGERQTFDACWNEVWSLVARFEANVAVAGALNELGIGAASLECWEKASAAFEKTVRVARECSAFDVLARAESGLEEVHRRGTLERKQERSAALREGDKFARDLVRLLKTDVLKPEMARA